MHDRQPDCVACRDTGWVHFTRAIKGRKLPWSAACLCSKGQYLSSDRPHHVKSLPKPNDPNSLPPPIVVQPVAREIYLERLRGDALEGVAEIRQRPNVVPIRGVWE